MLNLRYTNFLIIYLFMLPPPPFKAMSGRLVGDGPFCLKFWVKATALERNRRFSIDIRSWRLSYKT